MGNELEVLERIDRKFKEGWKQSEELWKQVEKLEIIYKVLIEVLVAPEDEYILRFTTPLKSMDGSVFNNILISVASELTKDGLLEIGVDVEDKNGRVKCQYYSEDGIEIYNIIKEDMSLS